MTTLCRHYPGPHGCGGGEWLHGCSFCKEAKRMIFYFIATRPYVEKAIGGRIYLTYADALGGLAMVNALYSPHTFRIYAAEAVNIAEVAPSIEETA